MKKLNKYLMLFVAAFALVSCVDDVTESNKTTSSEVKVGDEVQFGLSLPDSRTVYGDANKDSEGKEISFPIYWVNGDKVQVYSPYALEGRNNAEYKVILPTKENSTEVIDKPNYAKDLQITGDHGIQWGEGYSITVNEKETPGYHDFYSVYPSSKNYTFETNDEGAMLAKGVVVSDVQSVTYDGGTANGGFKYDMSNCLMYAKTEKVNMADGVVNLKYTPVSTVLVFALTSDGTSQIQPNQSRDFTIMGISLTAPEGTNIAGSFDLNVTNGTFADWGIDAKNEIDLTIKDETLLQGGNYTIKGGETIKFPVFLAPDDLNINGWVISIVTSQGTFKKTLKNEDANVGQLAAGKIHKITLPSLKPSAEGWDVSTWMKYIPRNVYLSEVSIPGSWNTLNSDYQTQTSDNNGVSTTIKTQYDQGVRAFHFDTRWRTSDTSISWGSLEGSINGLTVAGVSDSGKFNGGDRVVNGKAGLFYDYLEDIVENIKGDEYMVVMCTFAQDSYNYTGDHGNWAGEISYQCSQIIENYGEVIYNGQELDADTVVGDVLGKIIVIVNMEGTYTELPKDSACLFVNMPLTFTSLDMFGTTLNAHNIGDINNGVIGTTEVGDTGIDMYHSHAQISLAEATTRDRSNVMGRGYAPTYAERETVANNILAWSKANYGTTNYAHDKWIYLGLGGYYSYYSYGWREEKGSNATVASQFNPWINGKVTEMKGTTAAPYYPVGIVLMNCVNDYAGENQVIQNILMLNNKYELLFDPNKPVDYTPSEGDINGPNEE